MNGKQVMVFYVGMMMLLAGCDTLTKSVQLPSERMLSVSKKGRMPELVDVSPGVFKWGKKNTITENKNESFQIQIGGRTITISPPPDGTPIFTQPLNSVLWQEAVDDGWDFGKIQLYISGTVVLEYEEHSTNLQERTKDTRERVQGIDHLKGQAVAKEKITKSTYANTISLLETMTPGQALKISQENGKWILEVSFDDSPNGDQLRLKFEQDLDRYGYFYLQPKNRATIPYGDKNYEIRFDERTGYGKSAQPPYLMIRTELATKRDSNSLPGRRIQ